MPKHYHVNLFSMPYTTTIVPLLLMLSGFEKGHLKVIEKKLIKALEEVGCSESRYRRFKTDQDHSTPLKFAEVNAIYKFFRTEISLASATTDERMKNTLALWMPKKLEDVYIAAPMQQST